MANIHKQGRITTQERDWLNDEEVAANGSPDVESLARYGSHSLDSGVTHQIVAHRNEGVTKEWSLAK